jgi:hypothetical protein
MVKEKQEDAKLRRKNITVVIQTANLHEFVAKKRWHDEQNLGIKGYSCIIQKNSI